MSSAQPHHERALAKIQNQDEDLIEAIPLKPMSSLASSCRTGSHQQLNGQDDNTENDDDGATAGPSSLLLAERPLTPPPPPPPTPINLEVSDKEDDDDEEAAAAAAAAAANGGQQRKSLRYWCSTCFLFYVSLAQPCLKTVLCLTVMFVDVKLDNECLHKGCPQPVYTHDKAIYFLICVALFGLFCTQICLGLLLFARHKTIDSQILRKPMICFIVILFVEILFLVLAALVTNMAREVLIGTITLLCTEAIAIVVSVIGYANSKYKILDNNSTRMKEMLGRSGAYTPSTEW